MSNENKSSTKEVRFRHQATVPEQTLAAFLEECKHRRWEPPVLLQFILEERYGERNE